jgi:hypothetical protein
VIEPARTVGSKCDVLEVLGLIVELVRFNNGDLVCFILGWFDDHVVLRVNHHVVWRLYLRVVTLGKKEYSLVSLKDL